jgi:5-(carboxyamino)imidazole ribonucleotide synthase
VSRPVLGMVGAGQLARMTAQAVVGYDLHLRVLGQAADDSAGLVVPDTVVGSWDDAGDLERLASGCDVVTFDHELVDPDLLAGMAAAGHVLRPSPAALLHAQDKLHQRRELGAAGFPVPPFAEVTAPADVHAFAETHGWPLVLKAARGGYDGRGVWVVDDAAASEQVVGEVVGDALGSGVPLLVEPMVAIEREVAVAVARRPSGEEVTWDVTETVQRDGICVELVVPAPIEPALADEARGLARRIADHVGLVGLMAVELFVTPDGLVLNELALRPHNSVHWTIEGARTSQFANHARAVLDWPLGDTSRTAPAVAMVNVLGPADGSEPRDLVAAALTVPGANVHLYGKDARPGRKLGHVTCVGDDAADARARAWRAARILTGEEQP